MEENYIKSKLMKNKKAELLAEHTLKVIIAIMSVLLLLYLLFSVYSSYTQKKNFARAEGTLNSLIEKMNEAKNNNIETNIPLLEPKGWRALSYIQGEIPGSCSGKCICICEGLGIKDKLKFWSGLNQADKCEIRGVCKNIQEKINEFNLKLRVEIGIKYNQGEYSIIEKNKIK